MLVPNSTLYLLYDELLPVISTVKGEHSGDDYSVLQDVKKKNLCPLQGKGAEFVAQSITEISLLSVSNFSMLWPLETTHLAGFSSEACIIIIVIKPSSL